MTKEEEYRETSQILDPETEADTEPSRGKNGSSFLDLP